MDEGLEPWKVRQILVTGVERPNLWIDVAGTFERGLRALRCHASQVDDWPAVERRMHERAAEAGSAVGLPLAQAFLSILLT
jgi:LmbE family N-acetylglucosaminyl deacetylase